MTRVTWRHRMRIHAALLLWTIFAIAVPVSASAAAPSGDLALKRPVTSSPSCSGSTGPQNAVDGITGGKKNTGWCGSAGKSQFLEVDLGQAIQVGRIVVRNEQARDQGNAYNNTRAYTLSASVDRGSYTTLAKVTDNSDLWRYLKRTHGSCPVPRELKPPVGPGCENFGNRPLVVMLEQLPTKPGFRANGGAVESRFDARAGFRDTLIAADTDWTNDDAVHRDKGSVGVAWFRDWLLPLWQESGHNAAWMDRFFTLLSRYFPTRPHDSGLSLIYDRRMTTGEFLHFMSGAIGADLSGRAALVFKDGFNRAEFDKARRDFPAISYPMAACAPCTAIEVTNPGTQMSVINEPVALDITTADKPTGTRRYTATGLPAGLSVDPASGRIIGAPNAYGSFLVQVRVDASDGNSGQTSFAWNIVDFGGQIQSLTGDCVDTGTDIIQLRDGNGVESRKCNGSGGQTWVKSGPLLRGQGKCLTVDGAGHAVSRTCDGAADERWTTDPTDRTIRHEATGQCLTGGGSLRIAACTGARDQSWRWPNQMWADIAVTDQETRSGASVDVTPSVTVSPAGTAVVWSATGLPAGLSMDPTTGRITGTATTNGVHQVTITAKPQVRPAVTVTFTWTVADLSTGR